MVKEGYHESGEVDDGAEAPAFQVIVLVGSTGSFRARS